MRWNFFAAEFRKSTGETTLEGGRVGGSGDEMIANKRSSLFRRRWLKKEKVVTFYIAAPDDTNFSDATDQNNITEITK